MRLESDTKRSTIGPNCRQLSFMLLRLRTHSVAKSARIEKCIGSLSDPRL